MILLTCSLYMIVFNSVLADIEDMPEFWPDDDEVDCPEWDTPFLPDHKYVPWNTPYRAYITLPESYFELKESDIPEAGLGVFATTFIKRFTWLAEYEGEIIPKLSQISDYAWKSKREGKAFYYIDAYDEATSNWLRWINCSRHVKEENVEVYACKGRMYYVSTADLYPGQELLIYYGDGYAQGLDIDTENYDNMDISLEDL